MLTIEWPEYVLRVLDALERGGYEAWAVGGCVRDALLGRKAHDWDVCTLATPAEMRGCLEGFRLIDTGEKHGTLTAVVRGEPVEITTYRADGAYTDHRRPDGVSFVRNLREDLLRRDFTINAMACHPERGLADLFGGQEDLQAGVIRCVGVPDERFNEDGLRLLRAMRFAARFLFEIEPETAASLHRNRGLLSYIARERVYAELRGILLAPGAAMILRQYPDVAAAAVPQLETQGEAWTRALDRLENAPVDFSLRLALLMQNEERAAAMLDGLKADGETRDGVLSLVAHRGDQPPQNAPQARRLLCALGAQRAKRLCALWQTEGREGADEALAQVEAALARQDCVSLAQLNMDGRRLMALGCPKGKAVGDTLKALLSAVMDGALENEENALAKAAAEIFNRWN